jgi:hypothetical protein
MIIRLLVVLGLLGASTMIADHLTVHKVTLTGPSGTVTGKVVGIGDHLVFIDDGRPEMSFSIPRGEIRSAQNQSGTLIVEMSRPVTDRFGTRSNLELKLVDPASGSVLTEWIGLPQERARTVTTYEVNVRHDHQGQGHCNGRLIADDMRLRYESATEPSHSQLWNYTNLSKFDSVDQYALLKVTPMSGRTETFHVANGPTAASIHALVASKIAR